MHISKCEHCNADIINKKPSFTKKYCCRACEVKNRGFDLTNQKFGMLTVLKRTEQKSNNFRLYKCQCECGNITYVTANQLRTEKTKSCGCYRLNVLKSNIVKNTSDFKKQNFVENTSIVSLTSKVPAKNKIGVKGVYKSPNGNYVVKLSIKGKRLHVGTFYNVEDAIKARKNAEEKYFKPILDKYK